MRDPKLILGTQKRIDNHDYEALFAHGGCFHFALRLHETLGHNIRGLRDSKGGNLSHVWCQKKGTCKGIDIRGVYDEDLIVRLANGGNPAKPSDVSADELGATIAAKEYPPELDKKMRELADWIVNTHERFWDAKPLSQGLHDNFEGTEPGSAT